MSGYTTKRLQSLICLMCLLVCSACAPHPTDYLESTAFETDGYGSRFPTITP